jgi:hypothetical protein
LDKGLFERVSADSKPITCDRRGIGRIYAVQSVDFQKDWAVDVDDVVPNADTVA